jgi:hypothetical protein
MLRSVKELSGYKLEAHDGEVGQVHEFYFDDRAWVMRYVVVETGNWLIGRRILISPHSLEQPDWEEKRIRVKLSKKQIEESPSIDARKPVYRQHEIELMDYYKWPNYWEMVGSHMPETALLIARSGVKKENKQQRRENPHLRSTREVIGYYIQARDGEIGHADDFIIEDENWIIRYVVVDTRNWLPWSKKVILSPSWVQEIDWADEKIFVDLKRKLIENSPEFDPSKPVNREYEIRLYDFYGRPKYWEEK